MSTFVLIHGGWGTAWHWAQVPEELRAAGHEVVAVDLPIEDLDASFDDYADVVLAALDGAGDDLVIVGWSMGGQIAARVAALRPARELVYVAALIPRPGESLNDHFRGGARPLRPEHLAGIESVDGRRASRWIDFDVYWRVGCHDCDEAVARERFDRSRIQSTSPYAKPWAADRAPEVPARAILCEEDRLIDNGYWADVAREQCRREPEWLPGSHSPMAARPRELAHMLLGS